MVESSYELIQILKCMKGKRMGNKNHRPTMQFTTVMHSSSCTQRYLFIFL